MIDMVSFIKLYATIDAFALLLFKEGQNVLLAELAFGIASARLVIVHNRLVVLSTGIKMFFPGLVCQGLSIAQRVVLSPLANTINSLLFMLFGVLAFLFSGVFGILLVPGAYALDGTFAETGIVAVLVATLSIAALLAVSVQSKSIVLCLMEIFRGGGELALAESANLGLHGNLTKTKRTSYALAGLV